MALDVGTPRLQMTVNGNPVSLDVNPNEMLLDVLRQRLHITSPRVGCSSGECGACTVLLDGLPVVSCLVLALTAQGRKVITVEGLGRPGDLHPLQQAFHETGAAQCGFCTPGMILSAKVLLDENPNPSAAEIKEAMSGHLCRCTGYVKPVQAILAAASDRPGIDRTEPSEVDR